MNIITPDVGGQRAAGWREGPVTLAGIKSNWPPTVDVADAARALGVSRSALYESMSAGTSPVGSVKIGRRRKVLTASLVAVLEGGA